MKKDEGGKMVISQAANAVRRVYYNYVLASQTQDKVELIAEHK